MEKKCLLHLKHNQNLSTAIDRWSREANLNHINLSLIIKTEVGGKGVKLIKNSNFACLGWFIVFAEKSQTKSRVSFKLNIKINN